MVILECVILIFSAAVAGAGVAYVIHNFNLPKREPQRNDRHTQGLDLDAFVTAMSKPSKQEEAFFAARRRCREGVGLSKCGKLVYAKDETTDNFEGGQ
ncbi:hypothetical protein [Celeribacter sp. PS-C1]|uniref:hypothetical protein n=1 Tax=Celeribacter sp. PS-C1 TaxID=2820813 RepID=UPI001CA51420|nr:hypothetical protein [Celeribacter sp. PS-C1]MBW6419348.1 hypothetical protein [Celeribacter sp. PS-C1]